ncbi:hypothetical protein RDn1_157 [Candidatus Termititenax dinenymphae]|uniref:Uncharacterized protein n=1 Tax=Candidatus Termititenax dinenymphae TaxID=2218523 RepID=A0A388TJL8_9BACT|nr:hypothetical protein RDn1_157 [Candidatus Termititenax dinenymphae]
MTDKDQTVDKQPQGSGDDAKPPAKQSKAYSSARRNLTEEELLVPGVVNILIDEMDRLEAEIGEYKPFKEKYYSCNTRVKVLEERAKKPVMLEIIETALLVIGSLLIGAGDTFWRIEAIVGKIVVVAGAAMFILAIGVRAFDLWWSKTDED